jgi:hypothetical protein
LAITIIIPICIFTEEFKVINQAVVEFSWQVAEGCAGVNKTNREPIAITNWVAINRHSYNIKLVVALLVFVVNRHPLDGLEVKLSIVATYLEVASILTKAQ